MALVLCTGVDSVLMKTRQLVLESAGHRVISVYDECDLKCACTHYRFEVAVVAQSMSPEMKARTLWVIREHCPSAKILELYAPFQNRTFDDADAWLQMPPDAPQEFADLVSSLATKKPAK